MTEERDILKNCDRILRRGIPPLVACTQTADRQRVRYAFIAEHQLIFAIRAISGYFGFIQAAFMRGYANPFLDGRWRISAKPRF